MSVSPNAFDQFDGGNAFDQFTPPETTKRIGGRDFSVMPNYTVNPKDYPKDTAPAEPPRFGPAPEGWTNFYSGLDGLNERLNPIQQFAFGQLAKKSDDSEETQAQAINKAYVKAHLPSYQESQFDQNWPSIRDAYASEIYGIDHAGVTDKELYSAISERLKDEKFENLTNADWKEVAGYKLHNFSRQAGEFWNRINEPLHKLPAAPALPDVPWMGEKNPALVAGVYNGIKPLVEGLESPFGILTLGVGGVLSAEAKAGSVAARRTLATMTGIFTGLMAKSAVDQAEKIKPVLDDPKASFQDKVTAVAEPVGTSAMMLLGALGTVHELAPEFAGKTFKQMEGSNPQGAAVILRNEAKATDSAPLVQALHNAAEQMDTIAEKTEPAGEAKPAEKQAGSVQELDNGGFVVTDAEGKLIDYANTREEAQALAEGKTMEAPLTHEWAELGENGGLIVTTDAQGNIIQNKPKAPAELLSPETEEGFPATYNLTEDIPGHPKGSTVSRQTLEKAGFEVPEEKPASPDTIGLSNEAVNKELAAQGEAPLSKADYKSQVSDIEDAGKILKEDSTAGTRLIDELSEKPRPLDSQESAVILSEMNRLKQERKASAVREQEAKAMGDKLTEANAKAEGEALQAQFNKAAEVTRKSGTLQGRAFAFRNALIDEDYSLASMQERRAAANEGKLSPEKSQEVQDIYDRLTEAERKLEEYKAKQKPVDAQKKGKTLAQHAESARARIAERLQNLAAKSGGLSEAVEGDNQHGDFFSKENAADLAIVGADYFNRGVTDLAEWSSKMLAEFGEKIKPHLQAIYEKAVNIGNDSDAAALEIKKARLEAQIEKLQEKVDTGDTSTRPSKASRPNQPEIEVLKQERERLAKQIQDMRKGEPKTPEEKRVAQIETQIAKLENQLVTGEIFPKGKKPDISSPEIKEAQAKLEELQAQRDNLRESIQPSPEPKTAQEKKLASFKGNKTRAIDELKRRIKEGDFEPKKQVETHLDEEANRLQAEHDLIKQEYKALLERDRYENSSAANKIKENALNLYDTARLLMTTGEFSFILRQGKVSALSHPILTAKTLPDTFRALMADPAEAHALNLKVLNHPDFPAAKEAKLHLIDENMSLNKTEEFLIGDKLGVHLPLVGKAIVRFEQAATVFMNRIRFDTWRAMKEGSGGLNAAQQKQLAMFVNEATGRGGLGSLEAAAVPMGRILFSPRYLASRIQLAVGHSLWGGDMATRRIIAKEYAKTMIGLGVYYSLLKFAFSQGDKQAEIGTDPRSSDFGKVKLGNTRLDPLAGVAQLIVFAARTASGEKTSTKGHTVPIRGDNVPYGGQKWSDVAATFARSKLHPVPGAIINLFDGTDLAGNKADVASQTANMAYPVTYQDVYQALEEQDLPEGVSLSLLTLLGEGLQTYDASKSGRKAIKTSPR